MITTEILQQVTFTEFLDSFKKTLENVFYKRDNIEHIAEQIVKALWILEI